MATGCARKRPHLDAAAPSSSIETHKFIANGFEVSVRAFPRSHPDALGARPCAPKRAKAPKLETAAVSRCEEKPPSGP